MVVWEPRDYDRGKHPGGNDAVDPQGGFTQHGPAIEASLKIASEYAELPPDDVIVLNRLGIGQPYLRAAHRASQKTGISTLEVLLQAGVISRETWLESQNLLKSDQRERPLERDTQQHLLVQAIHNLRQHAPHYSAEQTFSIPQILLALILIAVAAIGVFSFPFLLASAVIVFLATVYFSSILFRGALLFALDGKRPITGAVAMQEGHELPIYSVLVALRNESGQIGELTRRLQLLDWPQDRLDIKLICEEDDPETIFAIRRANLPACFEVIVVPPASPRTKPKALNYALPLCRGDYLVLYDAEDQPSPGQLREAYDTFSRSDPELACLQAPLRIHNGDQSWLSRMFAIEYLTLFNGILPVMARWRVPIPLGGTSNHFRTSALKAVGARDPFNVTEDADLGVRLYREGYRCSTINLPTFEEAPPSFRPWLTQRTRWLKGWMQTILVHSRNPFHLVQDIGLKNTIVFHLILTSIVVSTLIHPVFIVYTINQFIWLHVSSLSAKDSILVAGSVFNLVGGYTTYGLLALAVLRSTGYQEFAKSLVTLPVYWLLLSIAGWRALVHLFVVPHHWEKTPHGLAIRASRPK